MKQVKILLSTLILLLAFSLLEKWQPNLLTPGEKKEVESAVLGLLEEPQPKVWNAVVQRVVDGDTIVLTTGQTVRYIGIDTPETKDPRKEVQCFGIEASNYNAQLVEGKTITLAQDVSTTDRYGRVLAYVYVQDEMVNEKLVMEGYARVATFPPDVAHQQEFEAAQKEAQLYNRGLWSACQ